MMYIEIQIELCYKR